MTFKEIIQFIKETASFPATNDIRHYSFKKFQGDIIAALTVGMIILPQSMADAFIAGIHPKYGLYAAIVPVVVAALFSSSRYMVNGPTNEVSMLLISVMSSTMIGGVALSAMPEENRIPFLFLLTFLIGVVQIIMGIGRLGNLTSFVSRAVLIGFMVGAGVLVAASQLKNLLGVTIAGHGGTIFTIVGNVIKHLSEINIYAFGIGIFTIIFIVIGLSVSKRIPGYLLAMVITSGVAYFYKFGDYGVKFIGEIPQTLPPLSMPLFSLAAVNALLMPAIAISILGVLGALTIAKSIADTSKEDINSNQELIAQGLSNLAGSFFSAMPGAGALTRTSANYNAGAETRLAGAFCGFIVLLVVLVFANLAKYIPTATLAGILMVIAYKMIDRSAFLFNYHTTTSDRIVLIITAVSTLFMDMDKAIYLGVFTSIILYLNKAARPDIYEMIPRERDGKLVYCNQEDYHCQNIAIQQIEGPLFFASSQAVIKSLFRKDKEKAVILRMKQVRILDATGAHALKKIIDTCRTNQIGIIFSGVKPKVMDILEKSGIIKEIGADHVVETATEAIHLAFEKYVDRDICKACAKKMFKEC